MMIETFVASFPLDPNEEAGDAPWEEPLLLRAGGYLEFASAYAGRSFAGGLYRFHDESTGPRLNEVMQEEFPQFVPRARPFAYDWMGRQLALDGARQEGDEPLILLLEPGTARALEVPLSFRSFHERLTDLKVGALASDFFDTWVKEHPTDSPLKMSECVGYRIPPFLGGADSLDNLELIDLDVYWSITAQLRRGTLHLPPGSSVRHLSIG